MAGQSSVFIYGPAIGLLFIYLVSHFTWGESDKIRLYTVSLHTL